MARAVQWAAPTAAKAEARLGQGVDPPPDGDEPPIDVAVQDFRSVWYDA
jgi:hypothetical protein